MAYLLSQLLKQSAGRYPDNIAIVHGQELATYQTLDQASNRFAYLLQGAGVGRGDRVGLYLEKSLAAVAVLFGILKLGAAYVPLDPAAPTQRIAYMVANCQMKALVSTTAKHAALQPLLTAQGHVPAPIAIDDPDAVQQALHACRDVAELPDPGAIENDLAYILYTSGSTGHPKGVMISHRAALTFVDWACETFHVQPSDRVSNHAPFHFDLSTFDLFVTIKAGGTVVLVPPALSVFPLNLAKFIAEQRITIWYSVPSALTRLVLYGNLSQFDLSHLRTVLFAGEVFPVKYLRQLMTLIPHASYHNLYGPTETNVCTWYTVPLLGLIAEREKGVSPVVLTITLICVMLGAWFTDRIGIYAVFGAFIMGAAMPRGRFAHEVQRQIEPLTTTFLLPLFFVYSDLNTRITLVDSVWLWGIALVVVLAACLGKGGACWAAARLSGEDSRSALAIGTLMNARGLMELIILNIGLQHGIITPLLFTVMVIMAIVTTLMTSPIFEWVSTIDYSANQFSSRTNKSSRVGIKEI